MKTKETDLIVFPEKQRAIIREMLEDIELIKDVIVKQAGALGEVTGLSYNHSDIVRDLRTKIEKSEFKKGK